MKIQRSDGITPTEKILAAAADRSFLRLWSYSSPHNDRTKSSKGVGQELSDLLMVFGNDVIIFSDKESKWQSHKPVKLAWERWYRRTIDNSINQLVGADRWLREHPNRVFIDRYCNEPLPIELPSSENRTHHLVAVSNGANCASRKYFNHPRGTFMITPYLKGGDHTSERFKNIHPFVLGDVNPKGKFVHVFDSSSLRIIMQELDTPRDFIDYLKARKSFIRSGKLGIATGEEDLLATYLMNGFSYGKREFIPSKFAKRYRNKSASIPEGQYETYVTSALYYNYSLAKEKSLFWDSVIEGITDHIIDGTSIKVLGVSPSAKLAEKALRNMASETRESRILLSDVLMSALNKSILGEYARFIRRVLPMQFKSRRKIGYVFINLPHDRSSGSLDDYREYKAAMLHAYCLSLLEEQRDLNGVVGISFDARHVNGQITSKSEDVMFVGAPDWDESVISKLNSDREIFSMAPRHELSAYATKRVKTKRPFSLKRSR